MTHELEPDNKKAEKVHDPAIVLAIVLAIFMAVLAGFVIVNNLSGGTATGTHGTWKYTMKSPENIVVTADGDTGALVFTSPERTNEKTQKVEVFADFSCPHCAELGRTMDRSLAEGIEKGKYNVHLHMVNFMDKNTGLSFSTDATMTLNALAAGGFDKSAWQFYTMVWDNTNVIQATSQEDLNEIAHSLIEENQDGETAEYDRLINELDRSSVSTQSSANLRELRDRIGQANVPNVFVDDVYIENPLQYNW